MIILNLCDSDVESYRNFDESSHHWSEPILLDNQVYLCNAKNYDYVWTPDVQLVSGVIVSNMATI